MSGLSGRGRLVRWRARAPAADVASQLLSKKALDEGGGGGFAGKRGREGGEDDAGASPARPGKAARATEPARDPHRVVIWNANGLPALSSLLC